MSHTNGRTGRRPGRRAFPVLLTVPLVLGGCADPPRQARPVADAGGRSIRHAPPPATGGAQAAYVDNLSELSEVFSSATTIQHILDQQRHRAEEEIARRTRPVLRPAPNFPPYVGAEVPTRTAEEAPDNPPTADAGAQPGTGKRVGKGKAKPPVNVVKVALKPVRRAPPDPWETVRSNLVLSGIEHEAVTAQLEHLRVHAGAVDSLMKRAEPYLQYLLEEINRQGLPTDLVLVPMVESAFQTTALSPKQAAGLWQFIPATGQRYGLRLSETFDGRYDPHAATQAALKYLKFLHKLFDGDWLLAFAGYNAGERAVQRAIEVAKRDGLEGAFWDLNLPAETENYVVKIVALSRLIADPVALGMKPRKAVNTAFLTRVQAAPDVRIPDLIATSGIPPEEFYRLNPAYKPDVEPPADLTRNFLLPPTPAAALQTANLAGTKVYLPRTVVVQKGDTLSILAKRHGVPEVRLAQWNGLKARTHLKAGQELLVNPV